MNKTFFKIRIQNRIAVLGLTHPVKTCVDLANFSFDLSETLDRVKTDDNIRVLVLISTVENTFAMDEEIILQTVALHKTEQRQIRKAVEMVAELDRPVIAAIRGNAVGFGLELALTCDIRFAENRSLFGLPHVKAGQLPWCGGSQRLPRIVNKGMALEMMLTGKMIDAETALRKMLISRIVTDNDLEKKTMQTAELLAQKGPISVGFIKEAVNKGMDLTLEQGLRLEADLYYLLHTTKDRTEGVKAFQERREADFSGE